MSRCGFTLENIIKIVPEFADCHFRLKVDIVDLCHRQVELGGDLLVFHRQGEITQDAMMQIVDLPLSCGQAVCENCTKVLLTFFVQLTEKATG